MAEHAFFAEEDKAKDDAREAWKEVVDFWECRMDQSRKELQEQVDEVLETLEFED